MKLVSNSCIAGFLYKYFNLPYHSPFVWCRIPIDDFALLMDNFLSLNFGNIRICRNGDVPNYAPLTVNRDAFCIIIDNKVRVFYNHYKYKSNATVPIVQVPDVFYCKPYEYTLNKYIERAKRLTSDNISPIFIYQSNTTLNYPIERQWEIIDTEISVSRMCNIAQKYNYRLLVITQFDSIAKYKCDNILPIVGVDQYQAIPDIIKLHETVIKDFLFQNTNNTP